MSSEPVVAQDINFSQFYELPLLRNPALAGIFNGDIRFEAAYRTQWGSVTVPYRTEALGGEIRMPFNSSDYVTAGMQVTHDVAGDSKLTKIQLLPVIALNKCLSPENNTYLSFGVSGGAVQQSFDPSQLKFDDQFVNGSYNASNTTQETFSATHLIYWDLTAGLSFSAQPENTGFYVGVALFHINRARVSFDPLNGQRLNQKLVVNGGLIMPSGEHDQMTVYADLFFQGGNRQGQGGFMYKRNIFETDGDEQKLAISAGTFFRWNDAVIPVIKFDYYKTTLGITYDINISKLRTASQLRGAGEITLTYRDFLKRYNNEDRKTRCPAKF